MGSVEPGRRVPDLEGVYAHLVSSVVRAVGEVVRDEGRDGSGKVKENKRSVVGRHLRGR